MRHPRDGRPGAEYGFFRKLGALSGGHIVAKILAFLVFTVLARTLDRHGYGAVEYLIGLSVLFATVVESGLGAVGVRRIAHHADDLPRLAAQVPAARLALALISVPIMVLVAGSARLGAAPHGLVWVFALSLLPAAWRQDWLLQATGRMTEAALAQALHTIVFAVIVLTLVRDSGNLLVVGWAEVAAVAAMSLYTIIIQQVCITPWRLRPPADGFLALAREGALLGLGNVVWVVNQYAPLFLVATLVGGDETAWFAAAGRIIGSLLTFSYLYFFGLYPAIARGTMRDRVELARVLAASFRVAAWTSTLAALALALLAAPVSVLVFGSRFGPSAPLLAVGAWVLPLGVLSGHARWALVAAGLQLRVVHAQLAGMLTVTVLGVPLVLLLGGMGAALASVAAALAVWLAAHTLAVRNGTRLPSITLALRPGAVALAVVLGIQGLGLHGWSAGLGAVFFAALAPLADPRLLSDVASLGATRLDAASFRDPAP